MSSTPVASSPVDVVAIGASAGGVLVLKQIATQLPAEFPVPIVVVQHCAADRPNLLPLILRRCSALSVREAEHGEPLSPGCIYVAPPGLHLTVEQRGYITLRDGPKIAHSRPSIDLLFGSLAESHRDGVLGVLLTGSNHDGAWGVSRIDRAGGIVIVQEGAAYPQMPTAAVATGAVHHQLPLESLAPAIVAFCMVPGVASWMQRFTTNRGTYSPLLP